MKVKSVDGYLYVNDVRATFDLCKMKSNIDPHLMRQEDLLNNIMKTNSFKSIKQKRYTKADLINASLRFDYKNHIVINADMKEVVCFKDKDVVESFYICLNEVQKYQG